MGGGGDGNGGLLLRALVQGVALGVTLLGVTLLGVLLLGGLLHDRFVTAGSWRAGHTRKHTYRSSEGKSPTFCLSVARVLSHDLPPNLLLLLQ